MKQLASTCPRTMLDDTWIVRPVNILKFSSHWPESRTSISPVSARKDSTVSSLGE